MTVDRLEPEQWTQPIIEAYDQLVRVSEMKGHPVRKEVVHSTDPALFAQLVGLATAMTEAEQEDKQLGEVEVGDLRDAFAAYRQKLQVELTEEACQ